MPQLQRDFDKQRTDALILVCELVDGINARPFAKMWCETNPEIRPHWRRALALRAEFDRLSKGTRDLRAWIFSQDQAAAAGPFAGDGEELFDNRDGGDPADRSGR